MALKNTHLFFRSSMVVTAADERTLLRWMPVKGTVRDAGHPRFNTIPTMMSSIRLFLISM